MNLFNSFLLLASSLIISTQANEVLPMPPEPKKQGEQYKLGESGGYFTFDDKPAVIISGSVHYPRVPRPSGEARRILPAHGKIGSLA